MTSNLHNDMNVYYVKEISTSSLSSIASISYLYVFYYNVDPSYTSTRLV